MSFTRAQQGKFRPLVARAWAAARKPHSHPDWYQRAWYEAELLAATGKTSTAECDAKRDFEDAMAHFETIAGDSIYWQTRRFGGDARRILHEIRALAKEFDCDEDYMRGIATQSLRRTVSDLRDLTAEDLMIILVSLKRQVRRQQRAGVETDRPRHTKVDAPF